MCWGFKLKWFRMLENLKNTQSPTIPAFETLVYQEKLLKYIDLATE